MWIPQTIWKGTSAHQANIHQMLYGGGFRGNPAPPPSPFEIHIHVYFFHYEMLQFYFRNTDTNSLLFFMLHIFWKQTPGLGLKWLHVRVSLIRFDLNSEQHYSPPPPDSVHFWCNLSNESTEMNIYNKFFMYFITLID